MARVVDMHIIVRARLDDDEDPAALADRLTDDLVVAYEQQWGVTGATVEKAVERDVWSRKP